MGAESEYAPGLPYSNPNDPQWQVYFSTDSNYPLPILSFLDSYSCYNEFDTLYHIPDSHIPEPLGITVTLNTYTWPFYWYGDVVFVYYKIQNDTTYSLNNVYAGVCFDVDIGNEAGSAANDITGLDLSRKLGFGYQEEPEPGWDWVGKFGVKLLSPQVLAAFKRSTLSSAPAFDAERYLMLAGYDWMTGMYDPYDSLPPLPDDQRFVLSSGPFSLMPGDSLLLDYVIIGSIDTIIFDTTDLKMKADSVQHFYDNFRNYGCHDVLLAYPNGGEVLAGSVTVSYSAISSTGNPLNINILLSTDAGGTWSTIDSLLPNTGTYIWDTGNQPDGFFYLLGIFAYDSLIMGADVSDDVFTINGPGNGPPCLHVIAPQDSDTVSGDFDITWYARDPEFLDSLLINIYFKSHYDTVFQTVATNEPNDSIYTWNTVSYRNGSGTLIVETSDDTLTVADTIQVYVLNEISGGPMNHISGLNNCVDLSVLIHQPGQITGHTYELRFLQHRLLLYDTYYYPEYIYEITDSNTGLTILDTYSLKDGYISEGMGISISDYSPIVDGFSIKAHAASGRITQANFHSVSVNVVIGSYPEDSINLLNAGPRNWWAYRGSQLQIDWVTHANGGLTLLVTDLSYGDTIPYKPYSLIQNPDSAFGWCFRESFVGGVPSDTLRANDSWIMLCGERINFSRLIPPPQVNDRWLVNPYSYASPIKGNIYRFTPTGVNERMASVSSISFQVFPVPATKNLTIAYSVTKSQKVKIVVYDVLGRQVKKIKDGIENPGHYNIFWDRLDDNNRRVSAGIYFCRFTTGEKESYRETKKFVILK